MDKLNYLNVGCGNKFHKDWVNVDMVSKSPYVESCNLVKGMPFLDNQFDVIYHSQVLEHIPKDKAHKFIKECLRVLKPGGIIRVVVPDLENIVDEYKKHLVENIENPNSLAEANYDWILLEMYDQTVRNYTGGQMAEFIQQPELINEHYIMDRIGYVGKSIRNDRLEKDSKKKQYALLEIVKKSPRWILRKIKHIFSSEEARIGAFRLGGEIHVWMYDRYSLTRLLKKSGFENIEIKTPSESNVPNWGEYELDVKDGVVFDPTSLFVEAKKSELK